MARVQSGQARAWPLAPDRRRYRGSVVKGGRRSFPEETRSALDRGGVPPHTQRAIPGPRPSQDPCSFRALGPGSVLQLLVSWCAARLHGKWGIDIALNRWYCGQVGYGHRGVSCGWTICPAPGHSAVARRGVIAMRRFGLIVALGALLGMLGGAATAAPALAVGGRGGGWVFQAVGPGF